MGCWAMVVAAASKESTSSASLQVFFTLVLELMAFEYMFMG
jgi:hypothetical protein